MPIVKSKPTSPGRRFVVRVVNPDLLRDTSKALLAKKSKTGDVIMRVALLPAS